MHSRVILSLLVALVAYVADARRHMGPERTYRPSAADFEADAKFIRDSMSVTSEVPDRLSNVTAETFASYFQAGRPLIVTDMIDGWGMKDWSCESVSKDFGDEKVMVWSYREGQKWFTLKNLPKWQNGKMHQEDTEDPKAPKYLSYHWYPVQMGVPDDFHEDRAHEDGDDYHSTLASPASRRKIKAAYDLPYFIEPNAMNLEFTKERIEVRPCPAVLVFL